MNKQKLQKALRVAVPLDNNGVGAQGELYLRVLTKIPAGFKKMKKLVAVKGDLIVGHSETGHHHVVPATDASVYQDPRDPLKLYLDVKTDTALVHLRDYDTHGPIALNKGDLVEVSAGRELRDNTMKRVFD
jgi:hypothetical protein